MKKQIDTQDSDLPDTLLCMILGENATFCLANDRLGFRARRDMSPLHY